MEKGGMCEHRDRGGEERRNPGAPPGFSQTPHQLFKSQMIEKQQKDLIFAVNQVT